jgi:hypothetical protein
LLDNVKNQRNGDGKMKSRISLTMAMILILGTAVCAFATDPLTVPQDQTYYVDKDWLAGDHWLDSTNEEWLDLRAGTSGGSGSYSFALIDQPDDFPGILTIDGKFRVDKQKAFAGVYTVRITDNGNGAHDDVILTVPMTIVPNSLIITDNSTEIIRVFGAPYTTVFTVEMFDLQGNDVTHNVNYGQLELLPGNTPKEFTYTPGDINAEVSFRVKFTAETLAGTPVSEITSGIFRVITTSQFTVSVVDPNSNPVPNANVTVDYDGADPQVTDDQGQAVFYMPSANYRSYVYSVNADGFIPVQVASGQTQVQVTLYPAGANSFTGIVTDTNGDPIADIIVSAMHASNETLVLQATTLADGTYTLMLPDGMPADGWTLTAGNACYSTVVLTNQTVGEVNFDGINALQLRTLINVEAEKNEATGKIDIEITAQPNVFDDLSEINVQLAPIYTTTGALSAPQLFATTVRMSYSVDQNFALYIRADTSEDHNPLTGYAGSALFLYDFSEDSVYQVIDVTGGKLCLDKNGQLACVEIENGGINKKTLFFIRQIPKTIDPNKWTGGSVDYLYQIAAYDAETGALLSNDDINEMIVTLPFDVSVIKPSEFATGGDYCIYYANSAAALESGSGTALPVSQIISVDYLGDGVMGSVTFMIDRAAFFAIGERPGAVVVPEPEPTGGGHHHDGGWWCFIETAGSEINDMAGGMTIPALLLGIFSLAGAAIIRRK